MASFGKDQLTKRGTHTVGTWESWTQDTVINGAVCDEDVDNYVLGETFFKVNVATGEKELHVKYATAEATAENTVLLTTPEVRLADEPLCNFYNAKGEKATCTILTINKQFATSAVEGEAEIGDTLAWDATKKKFVKADGEGTAKKSFVVVEVEAGEAYTIDGATLYSLRVVK